MKAAEQEANDKIKIDEETVGVTFHKGSKWESTWKDFKEQNPLVQSKGATGPSKILYLFYDQAQQNLN